MNGEASKTFEVTVGQGKLAKIVTTGVATDVTNKESVTIYVNEAPKDVKDAKLVNSKMKMKIISL